MRLLKVGKQYYADCYPCSIKNGMLEYFQNGWKKTKSFTVVEGVELPERWGDVSWLEIAKLCDQYGMEVANVFADCKVAGIVSRQTAAGYTVTYRLIKHLITEDFNPVFFECLKNEYTFACFGVYLFDLVETEERLAKIDPEYDRIKCTYKGRTVSMRDYVVEKYGEVYAEAIHVLNCSGIEKNSIEPIKL